MNNRTSNKAVNTVLKQTKILTITEKVCYRVGVVVVSHPAVLQSRTKKNRLVVLELFVELEARTCRGSLSVHEGSHKAHLGLFQGSFGLKGGC